MPITIHLPTSGRLGPGFEVSWTSSFIGPLPSGSQWRFSLDPALEPPVQPYIGFVQPTDVTTGQFVILSNTNTTPVQYKLQDPIADGTTVHVTVQLEEPGNVVIDSGSQTAQWDVTDGLGTQVYEKPTTGTSGGLTPAQDATLTDIWNFVQREFSDLQGLASATPIGNLLSHPPVEFLGLCPGGTLTGRGSLDPRITGLLVPTYGMALTVSGAPPGAGLRDGAVQIYATRVAQLVQLIHVAGSTTDYVKELFELFASSYAWYWIQPFPAQILYDVTPGYEVSYQWVCFNG